MRTRHILSLERTRMFDRFLPIGAIRI